VKNLAAGLFLEENQWVSATRVSGPSFDDHEEYLLVNISPDGHDLIRDHGIQEFEQKIESRLSSAGLQGSAWRIGSVQEDIWSRFETGLNRKFPRVLSRLVENPYHRLLIVVEPGLSCFRGHFPGNPVLAGVTQLHWAACATCSLYGFSELPAEVKRLKFKSTVLPPRILELAMRKTRENEVQFEFSSLGQVHSQGSLIFAGQISC
jgi:3-hydroxymyristoyl/3-hydroxydecanoyl-(acyl carrier protein) dehydratase